MNLNKKKLVLSAVGVGVCLSVLLAVLRVCGTRDVSSDAAKVPEVQTVVRTETVTLTNFVEEVVTVTNGVTVTNVVELKPPARILSLRKTAPYVVTSDTLPADQLLQRLSKQGARVVRVYPASRALVEATDAMVAGMREESGLYRVEPLAAEDKVGVGILPLTTAGEKAKPQEVAIRVYPISSIDVGQIVTAVQRLDGEASAQIIEGRPVVLAKISTGVVLELARRGDVRRIERDR